MLGPRARDDRHFTRRRPAESCISVPLCPFEFGSDREVGSPVLRVARLAASRGARGTAIARQEPGLAPSRTWVVGSGIEFDDRGLHSLKGLPNPWQLLAVTSA